MTARFHATMATVTSASSVRYCSGMLPGFGSRPTQSRLLLRLTAASSFVKKSDITCCRQIVREGCGREGQAHGPVAAGYGPRHFPSGGGRQRVLVIELAAIVPDLVAGQAQPFEHDAH